MASLLDSLSSPRIEASRMKAFAQHVAKVEAETGIKHRGAIINGLPPFDDFPTVEFHVPKDRIGVLINGLLAHAKVHPNIIINGIPSLDHFNVKVLGR